MSVRNLEPKIVWNHFEDLNAVPRPSKKEERIRQFMVDFGKDTVFDFDTEGIRSYIEGDWVTAEGTTLGADNGIGVAAAMSFYHLLKFRTQPSKLCLPLMKKLE
jgi:dipeptidase D